MRTSSIDPCRFRRTGFMEFLATYHSPPMPVSLMIGPHFSVSDAIRAASSIGVEVTTGASIASYLCFLPPHQNEFWRQSRLAFLPVPVRPTIRIRHNPAPFQRLPVSRGPRASVWQRYLGGLPRLSRRRGARCGGALVLWSRLGTSQRTFAFVFVIVLAAVTLLS